MVVVVRACFMTKIVEHIQLNKFRCDSNRKETFLSQKVYFSHHDWQNKKF